MITTLVAVTVLVAACAEPPQFKAEMISLTPGNRTATLALPPGHGGRAMLDVFRVDNPENHPVMINVQSAGDDKPLYQFSLYPPDQPARMAMRVPREALAVTVELEQRGSQGPRSIMLRIGPLPD